MTNSINSMKNILILILMTATWVLSTNVYSLQLSYASPPSLESAAFIASHDKKIIRIYSNCTECPQQLSLTQESSIESATGVFMNHMDLASGHRYESVYISYDPVNLTVFSILLR